MSARSALILFASVTLNAQVSFESAVQPVLKANCLGCHSGRVTSGGLALDSKEAILKGGNRGPAAAAGDSSSLLLRAVRQDGDLKMPPGRKLKPAEIAVLEAWVRDGLSMPQTMQQAKRRTSDHWAFQPIRRPAIPAVRNASWVRTPIDAFILQQLEAKKLAPSPEAPRETLLRRVSLDLTGLPPTPQELTDFLSDKRPDAYERVVDRLLASPHYAERWARHWLDIARYSDSDGYTIDAPRDIYMYRDWVIQSINRDQPFDEFVIEQLAGDQLPNPTNDQLIATGFHRNTPTNFEGGIDFEQYRVEAVADRVATTSAAFLGITAGCARCHDHKYDPISQREYYQLFAIFNHVDEVDKEADRKLFNKPFLELGTEEQKAAYAEWNQKVIDLEANIRLRLERLNGSMDMDPELKTLRAEMKKLQKEKPKLPRTMIVRELATPRETYIHLGGDFTRRGQKVQEGTPEVLPALAPSGPRVTRLDFARWLFRKDHPLTARVTVNRVWQKYFGKGIVDTENDFGTQGDKPSHQELLDWLAREFMEQGWSQKKLHRLIVTSAVYRQASDARKDAEAADPDNRLLARQNRLRLDAEIVRDAALVASGLFSAKVGGPSVYPPLPAGANSVTQVLREWNVSKGEDKYRRGLYTFHQRSAPHPGLIAFDAPDGTVTCTRRVRSNTPLQALTLLNDDSSTEFARAMAKRIVTEAPDSDRTRIELGYRLTVQRKPRAEELNRLQTFLADERKGGSTEDDAWFAVARVLLNLDEFVTKE